MWIYHFFQTITRGDVTDILYMWGERRKRRNWQHKCIVPHKSCYWFIDKGMFVNRYPHRCSRIIITQSYKLPTQVNRYFLSSFDLTSSNCSPMKVYMCWRNPSCLKGFQVISTGFAWKDLNIEFWILLRMKNSAARRIIYQRGVIVLMLIFHLFEKSKFWKRRISNWKDNTSNLYLLRIYLQIPFYKILYRISIFTLLKNIHSTELFIYCEHL